MDCSTELPLQATHFCGMYGTMNNYEAKGTMRKANENNFAVVITQVLEKCAWVDVASLQQLNRALPRFPDLVCLIEHAGIESCHSSLSHWKLHEILFSLFSYDEVRRSQHTLSAYHPQLRSFVHA